VKVYYASTVLESEYHTVLFLKSLLIRYWFSATRWILISCEQIDRGFQKGLLYSEYIIRQTFLDSPVVLPCMVLPAGTCNNLTLVRTQTSLRLRLMMYITHASIISQPSSAPHEDSFLAFAVKAIANPKERMRLTTKLPSKCVGSFVSWCSTRHCGCRHHSFTSVEEPDISNRYECEKERYGSGRIVSIRHRFL
jgi:hypothetical protein